MGAGVVIGLEKMFNANQENGESANSIQCRDMGTPPGFSVSSYWVDGLGAGARDMGRVGHSSK
jgi:hypothetical protein